MTAESVAVLCSQPWGTANTVTWSTILRLVEIWPRQAILGIALPELEVET